MAPVTTAQLIAGNWKMNGLSAARGEVAALVAGLKGRGHPPDVLVCPPATLLRSLVGVVEGSSVKLGGQTCHTAVSGAHTGDISAEMLKDAGASFVIVGHSERRTDHGEASALVAAQARAAWRAGLQPIICIGESEAQRSAGQTEKVLADQIAGSVPAETNGANAALAYEPIWAIGTGKTASLGDIEAAHAFIRARMEAQLGAAGRGVRLLYGGSVKPSNAKEILNARGVDGVLVGGASLKATDFLGIIDGARV
ncbi:MAG: triose-phosphate isomerase [Alphaproteobacteria bacterium]|nr:triose-phosphate isomerase [Alphaproteobacteria bacterium]